MRSIAGEKNSKMIICLKVALTKTINKLNCEMKLMKEMESKNYTGETDNRKI